MQKWKATVFVANDAKMAIDILRQNPIDLILMDIAMPEMDGLEATRFVRDQMKAPVCNVPIVAMTASALIGEREKCIKAGMNDYISKPFVPSELYDIIIRLLPGRIKSSSVLTELSFLRKRAEGDNVYIKEILEAYIAEMPTYANELALLADSKNTKILSAQAHKMKSPVALVGAIELKKNLEIIEFNGREGSKVVITPEIINNAVKQCFQTIEELKKELTKLG